MQASGHMLRAKLTIAYKMRGFVGTPFMASVFTALTYHPLCNHHHGQWDEQILGVLTPPPSILGSKSAAAERSAAAANQESY